MAKGHYTETVTLSKRQVAALLAGVRVLEHTDVKKLEPWVQNILTDDDTLKPLTAQELGELAYMVNTMHFQG